MTTNHNKCFKGGIKNMKGFKFASTMVVMLVLALTVFSGAVSAVINNDFGLRTVRDPRDFVNHPLQPGVSGTPVNTNFQVDGLTINDENILARTSAGLLLNVQRGEALPIEVSLVGRNAGAEDVRIRAYIGGYEYGTIEDETDIFKIAPNGVYHKNLNLVVPEDIELGDNKYTLYIEVFDDDQSVTYKYQLRIEAQRHDVQTYDVIFNPPSNVKAGQPLFASVRVENLGDNIEESIKVTITIPELGLSTSEYVDQLVTEQDLSTDGIVYTKKDSVSTNDLMLLIPENAREGDYQAHVTVEYNRGHSKQESVQTLHVVGSKGASSPAVLSVDSQSQSVEAGKGAVYKISVANLAASAQTYTVEVSGVSSWASVRVDPQAQTVMAEKSADFNVYVSPNEGTQGLKSFSIAVKDANGNIVGEKAVSLTVSEASGADTLKRVLEVAFVILLVILVIVGLVVLVKRLGGEEPEESVEGKTYY